MEGKTMFDAKVKTVIVTNLDRKGDGKDEILRRLTQFWTLDGELLATVDPCDPGEFASAWLDKAMNTAALMYNAIEQALPALEGMNEYLQLTDARHAWYDLLCEYAIAKHDLSRPRHDA